MNSLLIFSEKTNPRLEYVCGLLFGRHLGIQYKITSLADSFESYTGPRLNYSLVNTTCDFQLIPAGLLFETGIREQDINTTAYKGIQVPFATNGGSLPFDLFAAVFYLVSRYEEYLPFEPNQYGQFRATDTMAFRLGFLDKPVVDIWAGYLKEALQQRYPLLRFKEPQFSAIFTYDIDVAWAFKGRTAATNAALALRDLLTLQFKQLFKRIRVLSNRVKDPFDTYEHIAAQKKIQGHQTILFFLLGPKNRYNRNLSPHSKAMRELILQQSQEHITGIHPSYFANDNYLQLQHEKLLLESVCKKKITQSRQHYLRLVFPNTYMHLVQAGITDDYTMGFAELPGFRAGTCTAFNFYNLVAEEETGLLLHPNTFMEGTFIEDLRLSPAAAFTHMQQLVTEVKKVNGAFICIWHNHSLSDEGIWKGMKEVHDKIAVYAATQKQERI